MKPWRGRGGPRRAGALPFALLLLVALSACSSMQITTDFDPAADFSGLRSWSWMPAPADVPEDPRLDNTLLDSRIRRAVTDQLVAQGFPGPINGAPSFLVGYHVALQDKLDVHTVNAHYGYPAGWGRRYGAGGGWGPGGVGSHTYVTEYQQGSLILDIVAPRSKQLLWRGSAEARVSPGSSPEEREARIREAVRRILASFPPAAK